MLGCVQQEIEAHVRGGDARTTPHDSDRFRQIADPFSKTSRFWSLFTQWVCSLATTPPQTANSPPPNGGNCIIRAATRRRYTASQLLMLQNPHRSQPEVRRAISKTSTGQIGAKKLAQPGPSSTHIANKLAQQAQKRRIWGVVSEQGELFRA